ncbi:MAG: hypothetical protein U0R19_15695 [Bryobacteraceae bacterium]
MITPLLLLASLPHYQPVGPGQFRFVGPATFTLDAAGIHSGDIHISFGTAHSTPQQTGATVTYEHLWPGISAEFHHRNKAPELDFILAPGASTHSIALTAQGATKATILPNGGLHWSNRNLSIEWKPPRAWLNHDSTKHLPVRYRRIDHQTIGFTVEGWDGRTALRIDPEWVISAWHYDGPQQSIGLPAFPTSIPIQYHRSGAIAMHPDGFAIIGSSGPAQAAPTLAGQSTTSFPCILTLSTPQGEELSAGVRMRSVRWAGGCRLRALAIDPGGAIWVAGTADAGTINTSSNAYRRDAIRNDGFLMRIRKDLSAVEYATYLGTLQPESLDTTGRANEVIVTGWGFGDLTLPPGYRNPAPIGQSIAAIRFNADGSARWGAAVNGGLAPTTAFDAAGDTLFIAAHDNGCFLFKLSGDGSRLLASRKFAGTSCDIRHLQREPNGDLIAAGVSAGETLDAPLYPIATTFGDTFNVGFAFRVRADLSTVWSWRYPSIGFGAGARAPNGDIHLSQYAMDPAWRTPDALPSGISGPGLISLRATDGKVFFASSTGIAGSTPLVAAGAQNRLVLVTAAVSLNLRVPDQPAIPGSFAYQWIQFGDTAPTPAQYTFQGITPSMMRKGTIQLTAASLPMTVFPRPNASSPAILTTPTTATGTPAEIPFTLSYAGITGARIHTASVDFTANGGRIAPSRVPIFSFVDQLRLPATLELQALRTRPTSAVLPVACTYGIPVEITSSQPWLHVITATEVCPAEIRFVVDAAALEPATHRAQLTVTPIGAPVDARQTAIQVTVR